MTEGSSSSAAAARNSFAFLISTHLVPTFVFLALVGSAVALIWTTEAPPAKYESWKERADALLEWKAWAQQRGSEALRLAITAGQTDQQLEADRVEGLLAAEVARAITPPIDGASRCPGSVILGRTIDVPGERVLEVLARISAVRGEVQALFPRHTSFETGYIRECSIAETQQLGLCLPLTVGSARFAVQGCYFLHSDG